MSGAAKFPIVATALFCAAALRAEPPTALAAIKLLPRADAKRIARIEAREGTPAPERWYLLTHDETAGNGLREFVVAGGEVVASRALSQFAESVKPDDVIGGDAVKIDSDRAAKLAQQYALANNVTVAAMHYELKKDGAAAAPLWTVTCVDDEGKELAQLVVSAGKGNVISHDGFALEPALPQPAKEKLKTQTMPIVAVPPVKRAVAVDEEKKPGFLQRVGGSMQKLFTGKER